MKNIFISGFISGALTLLTQTAFAENIQTLNNGEMVCGTATATAICQKEGASGNCIEINSIFYFFDDETTSSAALDQLYSNIEKMKAADATGVSVGTCLIGGPKNSLKSSSVNKKQDA